MVLFVSNMRLSNSLNLILSLAEMKKRPCRLEINFRSERSKQFVTSYKGIVSDEIIVSNRAQAIHQLICDVHIL